jgi:Tfp pilus assembly protein PilO
MAINLNADMGEVCRELLARFKQPKSPRSNAKAIDMKQYQNIVMLGGMLLLAIGLYIKMIAIPMLNERSKLQKEEAKLESQRQQIPTLKANIQQMQKKLRAANTEYPELLAAFDDTSDLENLYDSLARLAQVHELSVLHIQKGQTAKHKQVAKVDQTEVTVSLAGRFEQYVQFKEQLASDRPLLHLNDEQLTTASTQTDGKLQYVLKLTTYTIDKKPYAPYIKEPIYGPQRPQALAFML